MSDASEIDERSELLADLVDSSPAEIERRAESFEIQDPRHAEWIVEND